MKTLKYILFLCWMIALSYLYGTTRTVALDGTQQYTSIQSAINASSNGDIVQVYPGEYFEHLNTYGRDITIQSLYPITHEDETINTTIIHSTPQFSCLKVNNQESVTIDGFTMMNNYPENLGVNISGMSVYGGGIEVYNLSSIRVLNCHITRSISTAAGGIYFEGINFFMSNSKIYGNYGISNSGGLAI